MFDYQFLVSIAAALPLRVEREALLAGTSDAARVVKKLKRALWPTIPGIALLDQR
jgi:hypothetical protein